MAYPTIASSNKGFTTVDATSTTVTPPSGAEAGDLLVLIFTIDGSANVTIDDSAFILVRRHWAASSSTYIFVKELESSQSDIILAHTSEMASWIILRIPNGGYGFYVRAFNSATSTTPNASNFVNDFSESPAILITIAGWDGAATCSSYPSNFPDNRDNSVCADANGTGTAIATVNSTASSIDPNSFTLSASSIWQTTTIAIGFKPIVQIKSITTGYMNTYGTTTSTIIVPSGTAAGDLMLLMFSQDGTAVMGEITGWVRLAYYVGVDNVFYIYYKQLTESLSNFVVTHAAEQTSWILSQIPGGDIPQISTQASGDSSSPNPPSLTHTFGEGVPVLWIACEGNDYYRTPTILGYPLNTCYYATGSLLSSNYFYEVAACSMSASISSSNPFDPATFTINSESWIAYTIAIALVANETPVITVSNYTKSKISDETGHTTCTVTFQCTQAATQWEARATTTGQTPAQGTGILVGSGSSISADTDVTFDVTYDELTAGDQSYRIDVYCYVEGVWY